MTTAAENGAQAIVAAFQRIASAAQGVSNASVSVSGVSMPGNAGGTDDFEGGWTKINERGGEVAFLPSGSAIIPADKSDRLIESSTSNTQTTSFSPSVQITITGQADSGTTDDMVSKLEAMFKRMYDEARADEYSKMSIKNAYT